MKKEIELFISSQSFQEEDIRGKIVVVIDILRASSTMVTAIEQGAKGIIPVADMDAAGRISQSLDSPQYLLCGEKNGKKIEGYDLGNSPLEYTSEVVGGKTIILNTTNGTKAVKRAAVAQQVMIGCFLNLNRVIEYLRSSDHDIVLICAGWRGQLSLEDLLCAGNIIYELSGGNLTEDAQDGVKIAFGLFEKFEDDIEQTVNTSNHARRLQGIIDPKDIAYSCNTSISDVLPVLNDGIITDSYGKEK